MMETVAAIVLFAMGSVGTAIFLALAVLGKDVVRSLGTMQGVRLVALKRNLAFCLFSFAAWLAIFIPAAAIFVGWIVLAQVNEIPTDKWPAWPLLALIPIVMSLWRVLQIMWYCWSVATILGNPDPLN